MGKKLSYHKKVCRACRVGVIISFVVLVSPQFSLAGEKPLTVDECLEIAFTNNLDISQTKKARDEAKFKLDQAYGQKYPTVDINAQSGYINEVNQMALGDTTVEAPPPLGPLTIPGKDIVIGEHKKADLGVYLMQPLYTGGRIEGGIRAATAGFNGSEYQITLAKSQVRSQVIAAFYQVSKAQEFKSIAMASREMIASHLKDATNLMDQGMILKSDLLPIDIRRLDMELKIIEAENAIARAKAALSERMGLPPDNPIEISIGPYHQPPWPIPDKLLSSTIERPEQKIIEQQVEAAAAEKDIAAGGLKPQVGLTASGHYGWPGFVATQPEWETWWQAGMNVSWNIFDMNQQKNEVNAAAARKSRLEQAKTALDRRIELDQINTRLSYEEAYRKMLIAKEKVASARENFDTKEDNFKVGMATNTDFLDAHTELMNAESELAVISAEVQTAWADYLRAKGVEDWRYDLAKENP